MNAPQGFILKRDAAKVLGCTLRTVDNMMKRKQIPFYKVGHRIFFKQQEILKAMDACRVNAKHESQKPAHEDAWDNVCGWLRIASESKDQKQRNLANETLRFIMKFIPEPKRDDYVADQICR